MDIKMLELAASVEWERIERKGYYLSSHLHRAVVDSLAVEAYYMMGVEGESGAWYWEVSDPERRVCLIDGGEMSGMTAAMAAGVAHARAIAARRGDAGSGSRPRGDVEHPIKKAKTRAVNGWVQCTECGHGHWTTKIEAEAGDVADGQRCPVCATGRLRISWEDAQPEVSPKTCGSSDAEKLAVEEGGSGGEAPRRELIEREGDDVECC